MSKQIENIDLRSLLFLPNINKITIELLNEVIVYERDIESIESIEFKEITVKKSTNSITDTTESFYVFHKVIEKKLLEDGELKDILLGIAIPKDITNFESSCLYSFFPLQDTKSSFNCVMHASYELSSDRNNITKGSNNKQIIKEQLQFLKEVVLGFAEAKYEDLALKLLTPTDFLINNRKFTLPFSHFNLEEYYINLLQDAKILQTVNNEYISIIDKPKILQKEIPSVFCGNFFVKLVKPIGSDLIKKGSIELIQEVAMCAEIEITYTENELLEIVNSQTLSWTIRQQVEVFSWWNETYFTTLPNLLKKQDDSFLVYKEECYFLIGDIGGYIPSWVRVPALNEEYQKEIFDNANSKDKIVEIKQNDKQTHISRLISQNKIYKLVDFAYRDRSTIITTINTSVESYENSIEFVQWLWDNYGKETDWEPPRGTESSPINYKFPNDKTKTIQKSESLYFGYNYGNSLSTQLFDDTYGELPAPDTFISENDDVDTFMGFMSKFEISKFPKIERQGITPIESYDKLLKNKIKNTKELGASTSFWQIVYEMPYILNLENILENLTTSEIILWINEDDKLKSYLSNPYYTENAFIRFRGNLQNRDRFYYDGIDNYLLFFFRDFKWVEINNTKYAPIEILNGINSNNNANFCELVPVIITEYIEQIAKKTGILYEKVEDIFDLFSFCDKITDLPADNFYALMLKLQDYDFNESAKLSKLIYRIIEQYNFKPTFDVSENKGKFFCEGKVLVTYQGVLQYYKNTEAYLPSSKIIIKKSIPIVDKGQRTSNAHFKEIFGCQEYNHKYKIVEGSIKISKANDDFQGYYKAFLKFALAYSERNANIAKIARQVKITLVKAIELNENKRTAYVSDEYSTIRDSMTQWYITIFTANFDTNLLSVEIENIYSNIANTPGFEEGKIGELFRAKDSNDREFLIKKEFGTMDVIGDEFYSSHIKNNFMETIKKINPQFKIENIDIDFNAFDSLLNCEKIIVLFTSVQTDVSKFKELGFVYSIDLTPYFRRELDKYIRVEEKKYVNCIFEKACNDVSLQDTFLKMKNEFSNFEINEYRNSIYFNVKEIVNDKFGNWTSLPIKDSNNVYIENYKDLNPDNLFPDEIANNIPVKTMIYFNKVAEFSSWITCQCKKQEDKEVERSNDVYKDLWDVTPTEKPLEFQKEKKIGIPQKRTPIGSYTSSEKEQNVRGNKGELIIYNLLCNEYGVESVKARSEAFVELGILKAGLAVSGQYDMSYRDKMGKEFFVEVKTTKNRQSFIISSGELAFAKENAEQFELYLVYDIDSEAPKYHKLPQRFWDDKSFRLKEIIERIEVDF